MTPDRHTVTHPAAPRFAAPCSPSDAGAANLRRGTSLAAQRMTRANLATSGGRSKSVFRSLPTATCSD